MEPIALTHVASGDFLHQIKWDGVRGVCVLDGKSVSVFTKGGGDVTAAYPELKAAAGRVDAAQAVLDGEIVAFVNGKPSFYHALARSRAPGSVAVRYVVFDLLALNGAELRGEPLERRQMLLKSRFAPGPDMALADSFDDGEALFALMKQKGMEGIVSKRRGSAYAPGKNHSDWFKTKTSRRLLCAVTGVHFNAGRPASLMLGVYREGQLTPVGHAGSGLSQDDLRRVAEYARLHGTPSGGDFLLPPKLTCWVRFAEWTPTMTLRQPVLIGFSPQPPEDATGEEITL